jgi:hypothetical protein
MEREKMGTHGLSMEWMAVPFSEAGSQRSRASGGAKGSTLYRLVSDTIRHRADTCPPPQFIEV